MATLINVKQLDTSVSSSIVNGDLVITGSLTVTGSSIFATDISASGSVSASRVFGVDVFDVRGAFKTFLTNDDMINEIVSLVSNNQIVWVEEENSLYQATVVQPDFSTTFEPTVTWNDFSFPSEITSITTAIAGEGLVPSGSVINIGAGNGILVSADAISLDIGSSHFQSGVEFIISSGSFTIDAGTI